MEHLIGKTQKKNSPGIKQVESIWHMKRLTVMLKVLQKKQKSSIYFSDRLRNEKYTFKEMKEKSNKAGKCFDNFGM